MNDEGQAYIATAVALGALLIAGFAAPAITYSSLASGTSSDVTARSVFFDEVDDVRRIIEDALDGAAPSAVVDCTSSSHESHPDDLPNSTTIITWNCQDHDDCQTDVLVNAAHDRIDGARQLLVAAVNGEATPVPGCRAECLDGERDEPVPVLATTGIDLRLEITSGTSAGRFYEPLFGGPQVVTVTCRDVTPSP